MGRTVGEGRGGAQPGTPDHGLFFFLFASLQGCSCPGQSHSGAAWKVCAGVSLPIYLKLVYSALPGALVNGVYHAPLLFVHPFQWGCCSYCSGFTPFREKPCMFEDSGSQHSPVFFFSQLLDTDFHSAAPTSASCHTLRVSNQNLCRFAC